MVDGNGSDMTNGDKRHEFNDNVYAKQKHFIDSMNSSVNYHVLDSSLTNFVKSRVFIPLPRDVKSCLLKYIEVSFVSLKNAVTYL